MNQSWCPKGEKVKRNENNQLSNTEPVEQHFGAELSKVIVDESVQKEDLEYVCKSNHYSKGQIAWPQHAESQIHL